MNVLNVLLISPRVFFYRSVLPVGFTLRLTCINILTARYFRGNPLEKWWNRELTLKCKLKCYVKPMKDPLGVSRSKGNQGTTPGKEKILLISVGIEPTTSGLDLPLLGRSNPEVDLIRRSWVRFPPRLACVAGGIRERASGGRAAIYYLAGKATERICERRSRENSTPHQSSHGVATRVHGFAAKTKALAREIPPATQATPRSKEFFLYLVWFPDSLY